MKQHLKDISYTLLILFALYFIVANFPNILLAVDKFIFCLYKFHIIKPPEPILLLWLIGFLAVLFIIVYKRKLYWWVAGILSVLSRIIFCACPLLHTISIGTYCNIITIDVSTPLQRFLHSTGMYFNYFTHILALYFIIGAVVFMFPIAKKIILR